MIRSKVDLTFAVLLTLSLLAGCSDALSPGTTAGTPALSQSGTTASGQLPPVESRDPNTDYQPAFAGQTRAPGSRTETPYEVKVLTDGLAAPWSVKLLPDGRFLITGKGGTLRIVSSAGEIGPAITGIPSVNSSGQGGLLDVLVAPEFAADRMLYFTLAEITEGGSLTAVGKARLAPDESTLEDFTIIYRATPADGRAAHYGSRLVFDGDGHLIVTTGERQSGTNREKAQDLTSGWGKVLRMTIEGAPVADNPFVSQSAAQPQIYTYGHRNVQGLAIHPETEEIWISEMGPRGGDELNVIGPGKNYGWPLISYGIEYSGFKVGQGLTSLEGMEQPVYYWDPVLAPSGMTFYDSPAIPEWKNNLFIGGLAGEHIARLILDGHRVTGEERLLAEEGQRFRDITQGLDGALYAVTDQGRLYRIGPRP